MAERETALSKPVVLQQTRNKTLNAGRETVGKVPMMRAKEYNGAVITRPAQNVDSKTASAFATSLVRGDATIYADESRINSNLPPV